MENQDKRNPQPEMTNDVAKRLQQLSVESARAHESAERALSEALDHALARKQFGKPLAEFQLVQAKLAAAEDTLPG